MDGKERESDLSQVPLLYRKWKKSSMHFLLFLEIYVRNLEIPGDHKKPAKAGGREKWELLSIFL